jgi:hypothetical protein
VPLAEKKPLRPSLTFEKTKNNHANYQPPSQMTLYVTRSDTQATAPHWDVSSYRGKLDPTHFYREQAKNFYFYVFILFPGRKPTASAAFFQFLKFIPFLQKTKISGSFVDPYN